MKHEVPWTRKLIFDFLEYGNLSDEQKKLMSMRTTEHSDQEIADALNISIATYYRRLSELKNLYDDVRAKYPELNFPERKMLDNKLFEFYSLENIIEFLTHIDWEHEKVELRIKKKVV